MTKPGDRFKLKSIVLQTTPIIVVFRGIQETGFNDIPSFPLYDLLEDLLGHPAMSTLSRETLEKYGFIFPNDAP
jgi:hypothetical protein